MVVEEVVNVSSDLVGGFVGELGRAALWLQAVGVVLVIWIIFDIINLIFNYKRKKYLKELSKNMKKLDKKLDRLNKKLDKKR